MAVKDALRFKVRQLSSVFFFFLNDPAPPKISLLPLPAALPICTAPATPFNRHGENAEELELMVSLGMSPFASIAAASGVAARALGRDDIGVLAPGMLADVAVWNGSPHDDIRALQRGPRAVFLGGERVV